MIALMILAKLSLMLKLRIVKNKSRIKRLKINYSLVYNWKKKKKTNKIKGNH